ncbi:diguanylate cyclase (GGDEF)-like protein [Litorivivens lipolytica]|uniref:diguanylate cyclase n=1 Tax=Litorivivens lipolytica TaxID=1524264 RepID=A0A7W4W2D1_9GAMM|nr:GGDEF domain-containing protein [Litorivivens lipolytica]MBB3046162.1 diguanylate cyclase (GGDEF)-like protein [Litorivivens lipolytica]
MAFGCNHNLANAKELVHSDHFQVLRICLILTGVVCAGMAALFSFQSVWLSLSVATASAVALILFIALQRDWLKFLPASISLLITVYSVIHLLALADLSEPVGAAYYFCTILGAFFFLGITGGLIYSAACVLAVLLLYLPPALQSAAAMNEFYVLLTAIFCTSIIAYYYEHAVEKRTYALSSSLSQLDYLANVDYLTGIANRRYFFSEGRKQFSEPGAISLITLDIDDFKKINDTYGHATGDQVLISVTRLMKCRLRKGALLGRTGGEEFCILLKVDRKTAQARAEALRSDIAKLNHRVGDKKIAVTISLGLATRGPGDKSLEDLLSRADKALYDIKHHGKNGVAIAKPQSAI